MNAEQYAAMQEELAKYGNLTTKEKMVFESGWMLGRAYELRRKLARYA